MTKHSNQHDKERETGLTGWCPLNAFLRKGYSKLPPASYQALAVRHLEQETLLLDTTLPSMPPPLRARNDGGRGILRNGA